MPMIEEKTPVLPGELNTLIEKALLKVNGQSESDLCKYLPGPAGGYMHHFTLRKLKHASPQELFSMLKTFILDSDSPQVLNPKPRAPRGSRKKKETPQLSRSDLDKIMDYARRAGDKDLLSRLSPRRSLSSLKRELIRSIKENRVALELWNAYTETVSFLNEPIL